VGLRFRQYAPEGLQLLAEKDHIGPRSHLKTASLCAAFEGPNVSAEGSARVVLKALLIAGDECERRASAKYFAQGFTEALTTLQPPRGSTPPAAPLQLEAMGQLAAGWQTAEPFFPEARLARGPDQSPRGPRKRRTHPNRPISAASLEPGPNLP
jgi:hypothetical protein